MKKLIVILSAAFSLNLSAQQLNNQGLYVTSDNELFSGEITSLNNGVKSQVTIKDGVVNGAATYYYASGKIMESGIFTSGKKDQKWVRYSEAGSISAVAFYNLGKKTGTWMVFDDNGKKRFEMNYTEGEKSGKWTNWDESGMVVNTKDYSITN